MEGEDVLEAEELAEAVTLFDSVADWVLELLPLREELFEGDAEEDNEPLPVDETEALAVSEPLHEDEMETVAATDCDEEGVTLLLDDAEGLPVPEPVPTGVDEELDEPDELGEELLDVDGDALPDLDRLEEGEDEALILPDSDDVVVEDGVAEEDGVTLADPEGENELEGLCRKESRETQW